MTHLQQQWEGACVAESYTLEKWLGGDESTMYFQTLAPSGSRAVVKLIAQTAAGDGAALLDLWHRIRQLRHPNLIELLDFGSAEHGGENAFYAVFEAPDETLATAVERSPLDAHDSREVLDIAIDALRYLHAQGLVIGALDVDDIGAVGERIKLSTGAVREAETSAEYREDVRLLGELWQQALMAGSPRSQEIAAHAADPNPQTRWTLAEIRAALNQPSAAVPVPVAMPAPPPAAVPPVSEPQPIEKPPAPIASAVVRPEPVALAQSRATSKEAAPVFRFPRWILVGSVAFLLFIFLMNRSRHAEVATEPRTAPAPAVIEAPRPALPSAPAAPLRNDPPMTSPLPSRQAATPASTGRDMWRVIAFTFRTWDAAKNKVEQINQSHPGLRASVFSPRGQHGFYLVSLGGRMTHDEAVRLQHMARGKGLPRDLYVQNYSD